MGNGHKATLLMMQPKLKGNPWRRQGGSRVHRHVGGASHMSYPKFTLSWTAVVHGTLIISSFYVLE